MFCGLAFGQAQHFGERRIDLADRQLVPRALQTLARGRRWRAFLTQDEQFGQFPPGRVPPAFAVANPDQFGLERGQPGLQAIKRNGLLGRGDDPGDGFGRRPAKSFAQQAFNIAKRHPAIERAAGGKGH